MELFEDEIIAGIGTGTEALINPGNECSSTRQEPDEPRVRGKLRGGHGQGDEKHGTRKSGTHSDES
jgi:hypothetical protein